MIEPGYEISGYKFLSRLGGGSFGQVWKVENSSKQYAIKVMTKIDEMAKFEESFVGKTKLNSPFLVKYIQSFRKNPASPILFIVMELCNEGDLAELLKQLDRKKGIMLNLQRLKRIFVQLLLALHELHKNNIIHRDIKLENIFVDDDNVKIGDFGCGILHEATLQQAKTAIGTLQYLSPEILQDQPYDEKIDVWALGVVFYNLCTLKMPFPSDSISILAEMVTKGECPRIPEDLYPAEVSILVYLMLEKDSKKRLSTFDLLSLPQVLKWGALFELLEYFPERTKKATSLPSTFSSSSPTHSPHSPSSPSTSAKVVLAFPSSNDCYEGAVRGGKPHGKGKCVYGGNLKGCVYEGDWVTGKFEGKGTYLFPSGEKYEGDFVGGLFQGSGIYTFADLRVYNGEWRGGKREGKGRLTSRSGDEYMGDFANNSREGLGVASFADGRIFMGNFKNDKFEGKGTYTWPNGSKFEGDFVNGTREGNGVQIYADGRVYRGQWKNDKQEGEGSMKWPDGQEYVGRWKGDKREGYGVQTDNLGGVFRGEYKADKKEGEGRMESGGIVLEGRWSNNVLIVTRKKEMLTSSSLAQTSSSSKQGSFLSSQVPSSSQQALSSSPRVSSSSKKATFPSPQALVPFQPNKVNLAMSPSPSSASGGEMVTVKKKKAKKVKKGKKVKGPDGKPLLDADGKEMIEWRVENRWVEYD